MNRDELRETLASLHETLGETSDVDDETRQLLTSVTDDIHRLLEKDEPVSPEDDSLSEQVTDMMRRFEANHPIIGGLLQRLSDGLANMGI